MDFLKKEITLSSLLIENTNISSKYLKSLSESQKIKISDKVASIVLSSVKKKIDSSKDCKSIEKSKGDFTKFSNFSDINTLAMYLKRLSDNDSASTVDFKKCMNIITNAINFLISAKSNFIKGFKDGNVMVRMTYDATVIGIVECLSLVMATCIEIKTDNYQFIIKSKNNTKNISTSKLFTNLENIVKQYENKKINKLFNLQKGDINNLVKKEELATSTLVGIWVTVGLLTIIILLFSMRYIIYFIYSSSIKFADHLTNISEMVKINTVSLDHSEKGNKVREKQLKWAEKLDKISQKIYSDFINADKKANSETEKENSDMNENNKLDSNDDTILI